MIPVKLAQEPAHFDETVRQPGLSAIDELVGRRPRVKRPGPQRQKSADSEDEIPVEKFPPFWREALDDLMRLYGQHCAYLAMFIELTGNPTVDHFIPKSRDWRRIYEWSNYRLCAGVVNAKKSDMRGLVDPVGARRGWFELNLVSFRVVRATSAPLAKHRSIDRTLEILNVRDCCRQREQYVESYRLGPGHGGIDLPYLERRAPFVAEELRRQTSLVRGDT